jgi:two-component system, NtrC family, response regulator HydG
MLEETHGGYWKTIIETVADGLMVVDLDGVIVTVNRTLETLLGYDRSELVGQGCGILNCDTCGGPRAHGRGKYCSLFARGSLRRLRCSIQRKDGTIVNVLKNASVLTDGAGNVIGGVETLTDLTELLDREQTISSLRRALDEKRGFHGMIGESPAMQAMFDLIDSAAQSDAPVVIYGESGTGKELVATAIHRAGPRLDGPFIKVNCAALNASLLESELFGHVKGAFTGADRNRIGRFEAASGGSLFLDEIGDMPLSVQVKLLRVLQEKEIERVGDHRPVAIDARIIAATHRDLKAMTDDGAFREDLYYRVGVIPVYLPPLRDRPEDIPLLINSFIGRLRLKTGKPITGMGNDAFSTLQAYDWPGNVRELINAIEYAFVLCHKGRIELKHLPRGITGRISRPVAPIRSEAPLDERRRLLSALDEANGNKAEAARAMGISRVTLYKRLKKHGIIVDRRVKG